MAKVLEEYPKAKKVFEFETYLGPEEDWDLETEEEGVYDRYSLSSEVYG